MRSSAITVLVLGAALVGCADDAPDGEASTASSGTAGSTASAGGGPSAGGAGGSTGSTSTGGGVPAPDFSCEGVAWPSTAPDPMQLGGTTYDALSKDPVPNAAVTVLSIADGATLATTTSDAAGAYTVSLPTGGEALALYTRVEATGYVTSYEYPPYAFWQDEPSRSLPVLSVRDRAAIAALFGTRVDPTRATLLVNARDCAGDPVAGATVTLSPAALVTGYEDDGGFHLGATTSGEGILVAGGVPAGPQEVTIAFDGHTWRAWTIEAFADSMVYTPRRP